MPQHPALRVLIAFAVLLTFAFALLHGAPDLTPAPARSTIAAAPAPQAKPVPSPIAPVEKPVAKAPAAGMPKSAAQAQAAPVPAPDLEKPGVYVVKRGDSVTSIARTWISRTSYMTGAELEAAIRETNGLKSGSPKPGDALVIPGYEAGPIEVHPIPRSRDFEAQAIYLTGAMAGSDNGIRLIRRWREAGGNAIVFDIKDSDGSVNVPFQHKLLHGDRRPAIRNLPKFIRFLHQNGLHAIARIALFRDEHIAQNHPELAVHSRKTGQSWRENGKLVWSDPSNPEMQEYDLELAKYVARSGADEIQFDYVRFPAEGDQKDAQFAFEKTHPDWKRADVITDFLAHAYKELHNEGVLVSLDVFGIMAWQRSVDLAHTGQDIVRMAKHCDVLSPMIYPSHFFGMDGYALPGDAPEHFISTSMERFQKITEGSTVVLRPWLQAFAWKTKTYSPAYIETQVSAAKDKGGIGFLFWNARNDYAKPFAAMPTMRAKPAKFFRVETPATPVAKATAGQ